MTPADDFSRNLKTLCSLHHSVSEVCRLTGINRQQFARYLNGTYRPSQFNLRRICDILGAKEVDLLLPADEFEILLNSYYVANKHGGGAGWLGRELENRIPLSDPNLRKYLGWYHSYTYSLSWPGLVMRGLVNIYEHQGRVLSKTIERAKDPTHGRRFIYKQDGLVTIAADHIYIAEQESLQQSGFSLKIMVCISRNHVDYLSGLRIDTSVRGNHQPVSTRFTFEYLGRTIDTRMQLRKCGLFKPSYNNINPKILADINNTLIEGETVLSAITR